MSTSFPNIYAPQISTCLLYTSNTGSIVASVRAGGLIAHHNAFKTELNISNSYNNGKIDSKQYAGGLTTSNATIGYSYSCGKITASENKNAGALSSSGDNNITNSYYVTGVAKDNAGATAVSPAELQKDVYKRQR